MSEHRHGGHGQDHHPGTHDHNHAEPMHPHPHHDQHGHAHDHRSGVRGWLSDFFRPHSHDANDSIDPALEASAEGIRAVKVSLLALGVTALLQLAVVMFTGSVALAADTIHNFADASTSIPLWIAFSLGRRAPTRRYTYGYRRAEDLAGLFVIVIIAGSAGLATWESVDRLIHPRAIDFPGWVLVAGLLGAAGNEFVARYRVRVGRQIGSEALIADGVHARTDALTSVAVAGGAVGVLAGFEQADAVVGLLISALILAMLKDTSVAIYRRMMDAVDPALLDRAEAAVAGVSGVARLESLRMRWVGHRLHVDGVVSVSEDIRVAEASQLADRVRQAILGRVPGARDVTVEVRLADRVDHEVRHP